MWSAARLAAGGRAAATGRRPPATIRGAWRDHGQNAVRLYAAGSGGALKQFDKVEFNGEDDLPSQGELTFEGDRTSIRELEEQAPRVHVHVHVCVCVCMCACAYACVRVHVHVHVHVCACA